MGLFPLNFDPRDAMGIAGEIGEYRLWPGERWLAPDATLAVLEGVSAHGLHHEHDAGQRRKPI
jgi:hypothetical protein